MPKAAAICAYVSERYPDAKLAGKTYNYGVEVLGIKNKKLPDLNDEFAKDVSDAATLDELKKKVSEGLEHQRSSRISHACQSCLRASAGRVREARQAG